MANYSDFQMIRFWEHLAETDDKVDSSAKFVGPRSTIQNFTIGKHPYNRGYVVIQLYKVRGAQCHIRINGVDLKTVSLKKQQGQGNWYIWKGAIEEGILRQGKNSIQIQTNSEKDDYIVDHVFVHWHHLSNRAEVTQIKSSRPFSMAA